MCGRWLQLFVCLCLFVCVWFVLFLISYIHFGMKNKWNLWYNFRCFILKFLFLSIYLYEWKFSKKNVEFQLNIWISCQQNVTTFGQTKIIFFAERMFLIHHFRNIKKKVEFKIGITHLFIHVVQFITAVTGVANNFIVQCFN